MLRPCAVAAFCVALSLSALAVAGQGANESGELPESAAEGVDAVIPDPRKTVAGYLSDSGDFTTLLAAIGVIPNLTQQLNTPGTRFTVFAPTNTAFLELGRMLDPNLLETETAEIVETIADGLLLLRNTPPFPDLRGVLRYHVIGQALTYEELESQRNVTTTQGDALRFVDNVVLDRDDSRPNATATTKNIFTRNGWVNVVDSVLLPFNLQRALNMVAVDAGVISATATPSPSPSDEPVQSEEEPSDEGVDTIVVPVVTDEDGNVVAILTPEPSADTEEDDDDDDSVCFPASATVRLADGSAIHMSELAAGHEVHVSEKEHTSPVFLFTHKMRTRVSRFRELTTASGHVVTLTGSHYLYVNERLTSADSVRLGDELRTTGGISKVIRVRVVKQEGLYAPHTVHGDMVVDGVVVSGYSRTLHPRVAHALLAPIRVLAVWGWTEPLGEMFYEGADQVVLYLPKGGERY